MIKYYRYFGVFLNVQEKWLNEMAHKGYRLVNTKRISYEFAECAPDEYQYKVEFVADRSFKKEKEYLEFLEDLGYTVFYKNINLKFSTYKVSWRPYGKGAGQISTNPGNYNKELLIVEKKNDGRPFELHTTNSDKAAYYKPIRNSWFTCAILLFVISIWQYISRGSFTKEVIVFGIIGIMFLIPVIRYQKQISHLIKIAKTEE